MIRFRWRAHLSDAELAVHADGGLEKQDRFWAEAHVRSCPRCRTAVQAYLHTCARLQAALPVIPAADLEMLRLRLTELSSRQPDALCLELFGTRRAASAGDSLIPELLGERR